MAISEKNIFYFLVVTEMSIRVFHIQQSVSNKCMCYNSINIETFVSTIS